MDLPLTLLCSRPTPAPNGLLGLSARFTNRPRFKSNPALKNTLAGIFYLCAGLDLNQRSPEATDLQSVVIDHSTTDASKGMIAQFSKKIKDKILTSLQLPCILCLTHKHPA